MTFMPFKDKTIFRSLSRLELLSNESAPKRSVFWPPFEQAISTATQRKTKIDKTPNTSITQNNIHNNEQNGKMEILKNR
jgi:hypothetical protein